MHPRPILTLRWPFHVVKLLKKLCAEEMLTVQLKSIIRFTRFQKPPIIQIFLLQLATIQFLPSIIKEILELMTMVPFISTAQIIVQAFKLVLTVQDYMNLWISMASHLIRCWSIRIHMYLLMTMLTGQAITLDTLKNMRTVFMLGSWRNGVL